MSEIGEQFDEEDAETPDGSKGRQRSTIAFPYSDFDTAKAVAQAIHSKVGHGVCSASQLAPWMNLSAKSSGFRTQLAAARLFGLVENEGSENYKLTELGIRVIDPERARVAKAESFLKVPLFKALYEKYKGGVTPPNAALEAEIVALGGSEKQKARARQVFESSSAQTGFREQSPFRLVMPAVVALPDSPAAPEKKGNSPADGNAMDLNLDPLILALLQKIPAQGDEWPAEKRVRWFRTFAMNVSQVYDEDDNPVELKIDLDKK